MKLIIVESPTKARTLKRFLGSDYSVEATMGHIKDLPKSKLGVDVENGFEPDYKVVPKRKSTIKDLKEEAKKAKEIYLATDPDREGEAIAQHAKEILENDKLKISNNRLQRIVFHEITKSAVEHAIEEPRGVNESLVDAQIARRVLDRLVGYKVSPLLWKKVRRGLSAGRVQSVAVRLIVEREREREAFVPEEYWEIWCNVKCQRTDIKCDPFEIKLLKINDKKAEISNDVEAKDVVTGLKSSDYKVIEVKRKEIKKRPYPPFTTSTMSQTASRFWGWSAKKSMAVAQRLYEEGFITYHRTDSTNISKEALGKVREHIKNSFGDKYLPEKPKFYKTKTKSAQEAHEAIRPTDVTKSDVKGQMSKAKFVKDAEKLYELIWKRFIASQMENSIFDRTTIEVLAQPENKKTETQKNYLLRASGQVMKFDGWRKVIPLSKDEEPQLPDVEKDEALDLIKVNSEQKFTQPPPRYNEASLIKTLEKMGIGRPSTYAPTISTIQTRRYVEKEEGRFSPTPVGTAVNDFLVKNFSKVFDYDFTADMEDGLDKVAKGDKDWHKMMEEFWGPFSKKLENVEEKAERVEIKTEKLGRQCPKCKEGELVVRIGRFGKFVSCSRFPDCDYKERYLEKIGMKCPDCKEGEVIVKRTRRGKKFYGCSRYPDCEFASWKKPGDNKSSDK